MKKGCSYPNFNEWHVKSIFVNKRLSFAPKNFYVIDRHEQYRSFFTFKEALDIEKKILRPNGWRLPTFEEWKIVKEDFMLAQAFAGDLNLQLQGFVSWCDMKVYKRNRYNEYSCSLYSGLAGYYWSSEAFGAGHALALIRYDNLVYTEPVETRNGLSIRCVALE